MFERKGKADIPSLTRKGSLPMTPLKSNLDQLFDNFLTSSIFSTPMSMDMPLDYNPMIDLKETEKEFVITAELPGLKKDDIELTIENNYLHLKGEKEIEDEKSGENYYFRERSFGKFKRSLAFSSDISEENVIAKLKNGMLKVIVTKSESELDSKRKVKIQTE